MPKWAWFGIGGLLLLLAVLYVFEGIRKNAEETGSQVERGKTAEVVIQRVEKADEVRETFDRRPNARYDECLRSSRTPANCERFLSH